MQYNSLLYVHGQVSLDGSLGDEGAAHTGECLPAGEHSRSVYFLLRDPCCLLDQLAEHLQRVGRQARGRKEGEGGVVKVGR